MKGMQQGRTSRLWPCMQGRMGNTEMPPNAWRVYRSTRIENLSLLAAASCMTAKLAVAMAPPLLVTMPFLKPLYFAMARN